MGKERKCGQCNVILRKDNNAGTYCTSCYTYSIQNPGHQYYSRIAELFANPKTFSDEIPFVIQNHNPAGSTLPSRGAFNYHAWYLYTKYGIPQDATISYINKFGVPFNLPYIGFKTR
ncbi:Hypothetical protein ORPV_191 [Orpheovirus IHUMI-LCC2]|uniref:Uncharacterized protein n=1 Tax=Orpheovirus IHUMI-LCC2 TaxID=2023057 RepID=A0A2I2L3H4_9VIRU|nr:Hypothetical protein ORPV_191 [Orpheovirus IHUMI-LCC2]SNW62095.1 Hypothetical protein ORPV_191 [Orpheovirus IHUMI-LCC2]